MTSVEASPAAARRSGLAAEVGVTVVVAATTFWLAFDGGSYGLVARGGLAIAVWWLVVLIAAFGLRGRDSWPRLALLVAAGLAAFTMWTGLSALWASSVENAVNELNRSWLYLGVFVLAVSLSNQANARRWANGLALGSVGIMILALASFFFPEQVTGAEESRLFFSGSTITYPLHYANAVAVFAVLAVPLLLRAALSPHLMVRAASVASIPLAAAVVYLTSSRGAAVSALVGVAAFLACTSRRWHALSAVGVAIAGSAAALVFLIEQEIVLEGPEAPVDRPAPAVLLAAIALVTGLVYGLASWALAAVRPPRPALGRTVFALACVAGVIGVTAANPREQLETFTRSPTAISQPADGAPRTDLLTVGGTGRWQHWKAAYEQFREHSLIGDGAGSYAAWWAERGSVGIFVLDAHSLYVEVLGELGAIGLGLLLSTLLVALVVGAVAVLRLSRDARITGAALLGTFVVFLAATGVDWMWESTAVAVVAVASLGMLTGSAEARGDPGDAEPARRRRSGARAAAVAVGVTAVLAQALPVLSTVKVETSQTAAREGRLGPALSAALEARELAPWAVSPLLQLALVDERNGRPARARRRWIAAGLERDERDWRLWLVAARLDTKLGRIGIARDELARAVSLNPRSALFVGYDRRVR